MHRGKLFAFKTTGAVNDTWDLWKNKNPWNFLFIGLNCIPTDGVYRFQKAIHKTNEMTDSDKCYLGFSFDYWSNGEFRVRDIKVEKGHTATEWSPGL